MADRNSPVGVFDSGVGGISVLAALTDLMPGENFLYYGDTANMPYGTKPEEEVMACVRRVMDIMLSRDVKAVVIACNTATSVAAASLRQELTMPIIGMEPALKPAALLRKNGRILVMATPNTLRLPKFLNLMSRWGEGAVPVPCPGLMDLVEADDESGAENYLRQVFAGYDLAEVDAVVLGCTHYVFLRGLLKKLLPPHVAVLDGNDGTARRLYSVLADAGLLNPGADGKVELMSSAEDDRTIPMMLRLLNRARGMR